MNAFMGSGFGRVVTINLKRGEKLLESIRDQLKKEGIRSGIVLCAIGSLEKAVIHRVMDNGVTPKDEYVTIEQPMELASLQGIIADGEPHFHVVISDLKKTYTGHLEPETTVLYLAEIAIAEINDLEIRRIKDDNNIAVFAAK